MVKLWGTPSARAGWRSTLVAAVSTALAVTLVQVPDVAAQDPTSTTTSVPASSPSTTAGPSSTSPTSSAPTSTTTSIPVSIPADLPPVHIPPEGATGTGSIPEELWPAIGSNTPLPTGVPSAAAPALSAVRSAEERLTEAEGSLRRAELATADATERLERVERELQQADAELRRLSADDRRASERASETHLRLRELVAQAMVTGGGRSDLASVLASASPGDAQAKRTLSRHLSDDLAETAVQWKTERARLGRRAADVESHRTTSLAARAEAAAALDVARQQLDQATTAVESARAAARGHGYLGIPARALDAYLRATALMEVTDPACRLPWWALAAIGRTESGHGTYGGAVPGADGTTLPLILGPVLDGTNRTKRITDTDLGLLDGDPVLDRAVGPMQFIPSTWLRNGVDASGDGRADPNNLYDAAFTAGRYLCRAAGDLPLDTEAGFLRAARAYSGDPLYGPKSWAGSEPYRVAAAAAG